MAFDLASAKPVAGFDLASAKPVAGIDMRPDGNIARGTADVIANVGVNAVSTPIAGFAGLGQGIVNKGRQVLGLPIKTSAADRVAQTQESINTTLHAAPDTQTGQRMLDSAMQPLQWLGDKADRTGQVVADKTGSPALGAAANTAVQMIPAALAKALPKAIKAAAPLAEKIASRGETEATALSAAVQPFNDAVKAARSVGYRLPPSQAGGPIGQALESAAGKARLEMDLSHKNAPITNQLASKDVGIQGPLTEEALQAAKRSGNQSYANMGQLGRVSTSEEYQTAISKVGNRTDQVAADFPEGADPKIEALRETYAKQSFDATSAVQKIRELNAAAGKNIKAPNAPEQNALGYAQRQVVKALEDELVRHGESIGSSDLVTDFQKARVNLAKIHTIEDALSPTGNVSAAVVARAYNRGVPLSGGLQQIAQAYNAFPKSLRDIDKLGGHSPFSTVDYLAGAAGFAHNPPLAAAVMARPLARAAITSERFQQASIKGRSAPLTLGTRAARALANQASGNALLQRTATSNAMMNAAEAARLDKN